MEFLKELLREELYKELEAKINEHNGNEANKDKLIKLGNLGSGEYVSKGKHDALQALLDGKTAELENANTLIADLKKGTKGNEELQGKVAQYEATVSELQAQLAETKVKSALKVALLSEKCTDVDYAAYVVEKGLKEQGKTLELDENDNIKGLDEVLSGLKTQIPAHFSGANQTRVEPNRLPEPQNNQKGLTKEEFNKMGYNSRVKLREEDPELYANMMKG